MALLCFFLLLQLSSGYPSPPSLESPQLIHAFTQNAALLLQLAKRYKFATSIQRFDPEQPAGPDNRAVTYSLRSDTIQFYRGPNGTQKLLYCRILTSRSCFAGVPFFQQPQSTVVPANYRRYQLIHVVDRAGFEDLTIRFVNDKIAHVKYAAHPD